MNIQQYLDMMKNIQQNLLDFLDNEADDEVFYKNFVDICENQKINESKHKLTSILHLLLNISTNHHRSPSFFNKIELILLEFKGQINKQFSNSELFHIFKSNKKILLFLIEEKMITIDKCIFKTITSSKYSNLNYPQFFSPEINSFTKNSTEKLPDDFYENRRTGENENYVCKLIQKDSVQDFIAYVNRNNLPLTSKINTSVFDTNSFLIKKRTKKSNTTSSSCWGRSTSYNKNNNIDDDELTLIKYAAFFGAIQIFKYLQMNGVKLTSSLWLYVIHSNNPELVHLLEENHIQPEDKTYMKYYLESIKCHHNDIAIYFHNNFMQNTQQTNVLIRSLKSYNFAFLHDNSISESSFIFLCKYDYIFLLNIVQSKNIDINQRIRINANILIWFLNL